jgi:hypothetical protein
MFSVEYQTRSKITFDGAGKPKISITLLQRTGNKPQGHMLNGLLLDTGADVTIINKATADTYCYPVISSGAFVLFGFNDVGRAIKALASHGMTESSAKAYLTSFVGRDIELLESLRNDYGITDMGIICDRRKVSFISSKNSIMA